MDYATLEEMVAGAGMLRLRTRLEPMGAGGLVYPPTYEQGRHIFRKAWLDGEIRDVVVLDSPQSQANRIEDALRAAMERGELAYPDIVVEVPRRDGEVERYSVLQLSHRIYDAVLLATELDGTPFPKTEIGQAVYQARLDAAGPLFEHAPVTLVLGGWDSHRNSGPLSAKIPRILTAEIIGVDAIPAQRGAVKFDPMDVRKDAGPLYTSKDPDRLFELDPKQAADKKKKDPSEFGFGNVPALEERGAVIRYAVQNAYISLPAVRRIAFKGPDGRLDEARERAGRAAVVALGLYGLALQREAGYSLRSGCDLLPAGPARLEVLSSEGKVDREWDLAPGAARRLLDQALEAAAAHGLHWRAETLTLTADEQLRQLVERSRAARTPEEG